MRTAAARPTATAVVGALVAMFGAACAAPFEAPSEYTKQRVLCGAENAAEWNALVEECAASFQRDGSCLGHIGLRGRLNGEQLTVQARITKTVMAEAASGNDTPYFGGFVVDAVSPYFFFQVELKQAGGTARVASMTPRRLSVAGERHGRAAYEDDFAELALRLTVGGESESFRGASGDITFVVPAPHTLRGDFRSNFGSHGELEGCFAVFGTAPGGGGAK